MRNGIEMIAYLLYILLTEPLQITVKICKTTAKICLGALKGRSFYVNHTETLSLLYIHVGVLLVFIYTNHVCGLTRDFKPLLKMKVSKGGFVGDAIEEPFWVSQKEPYFEWDLFLKK